MRIVTFTTLFPNSVQFDHGLFVEHRLRHLLRSEEDISCRVCAPVPWYPSVNFGPDRYIRYNKIADIESRQGLEVVHPRYPVIPAVGMSVAPLLLASWTRWALHSWIEDNWDFDLIDAHYFYPDGVAAVILGRWLRKPVVITARGTDVNLIPDYRLARRWIKWAASNCEHIITVCEALRGRLIELGIDGGKVTTLRNGVDLEMFRMIDPVRSRKKVGLEENRKYLLSVGHLVERKGHHLVIEALQGLSDQVCLVIVGDGEEMTPLRTLAKRLGLADRVVFAGARQQNELPWFYNAAEALVLASSREGMANVLLESIGCGTPVVATDIWGTSEVIDADICGELVAERTAEAIGGAVNKLLERKLERTTIRSYAERFSWEATSAGQVRVFNSVTARGIRAQADKAAATGGR